MLHRLEKTLQENHPLIILDCWNGRGEDRQKIIFKAKQYGAVYVHCLQFFIPVDLCVRQFMQKENTRGLSPCRARHDYALYYKLAKDIEKDGFDSVFPINPLQIHFHNFPLI